MTAPKTVTGRPISQPASISRTSSSFTPTSQSVAAFYRFGLFLQEGGGRDPLFVVPTVARQLDKPVEVPVVLRPKDFE